MDERKNEFPPPNICESAPGQVLLNCVANPMTLNLTAKVIAFSSMLLAVHPHQSKNWHELAELFVLLISGIVDRLWS
jgi:hypothetical protein